MRSNRIKSLFFIITFIFVMLATACSNEDKQLQDSNDTQSVLMQKSVEKSDESLDDSNAMTNESESVDVESDELDTDTVEPIATKEISIYTINDSTSEVEVVPALISKDSEITPDLIVEKVTDALADRLVIVEVDQVMVKNDTVIVSFLSNQPPLTNVGSGMETAILDAYAQSLVDNLPDYPKVIFRAEGKAYSSGHYQFGINEVYLDGSKTN